MAYARPSPAPLPEYPRPQMLRDSFINLNGLWEYAFAPLPAPPAHWDGRILVPFAPGSPLSGVSRVLPPDEILWFRTSFTLPDDFLRGRVLLHFGAVAQACTVFVGGQEAGAHPGGSLPFHFDITPLLRGGAQELLVRVGGGSSGHSSQSGIWQTVWLESVPHSYIRALAVTPLYDEAAVRIEVSSEGDPLAGQLDIIAHKTLVKRVSFQTNQPLQVALPGFISWHPNRPFLYTLRVRAGQDAVDSYFGMRKLQLAPNAAGHTCLILNNKPLQCAGVAHHGLYPGGLHTAPSDKAMLNDLRFAKDCGFNIIRKTDKIEPMRWYCHCDRLGLLVWQDLPLASGARPRLWERLLPAAMRPGHHNTGGQASFIQTMQQAVALLYNTPSLATWAMPQQEQNQRETPDCTTLLRRCDPTRPVAHIGGRHSQGGDIWGLPPNCRNVRLYKKLLAKPKKPALFLTQAGNFLFSSSAEDSTRCKPGQPCLSREAFAGAIAALYRDSLLPLQKYGLCGFFFYQLADTADSHSGLLPFDRAAPKLQPKGMAALNRLFLGEK